MCRTFLITVCANFLLASSVLAVAYAPKLQRRGEANWPQFRGSSAGVAARLSSPKSEDSILPATWSTVRNVVWAVEIPGRAWSSPVVWGSRIFVTSAVSEGDADTHASDRRAEMPKKGLYLGGNRDTASDKSHLWMVYCIDFNNGNVLWERLAHKGVPKHPLHIKNTYASETPVTDGERIYAYFGNVGLFCYDMDGNELWSKRWGSFKICYNWGTAASPVLYQDRLFIVNDNEEQSFLIALDKKTGKQIWRVDRDEKSNWATPYVWENPSAPGRTELVTSGKGKVRSYDLDGRLLWEMGGMSSIVIPTPFAKHGLLYISSGYVGDRKRPIYAIRPGAEGDITLKEGEHSNKYVAWWQAKAGPYNPSPIAYGDYLYVLYDRGYFSCYDARTGNEVYSRQRIAAGATAFTSSP